MNKMRLFKNAKGYSPVEILVAVAISMVIMGSVYSTFKGSTDTFRYQESMARLQENGRFAVEVLNREMRMVGYTGCGNVSKPINVLNDNTDYIYNYESSLQGFEANADGTWTPELDLSILDEIKGSDVVVLRVADPNGSVYVSDMMNLATADLKTLATDLIKEDDILMISDCANATVFQVTNTNTVVSNGKNMTNVVHNQGADVPGNSQNSLGHLYSKGAQVNKVYTKSFFIRENTSEVPSLYVKVGSSASEEQVEGVENLQITYGRDTSLDKGPDNCLVEDYVDADLIPPGDDWLDVCSIRIGLLLRSSEQTKRTADTVTTYNVNGTVIGPMNDRFLRRVYSQTIRLRNRPAFGP